MADIFGDCQEALGDASICANHPGGNMTSAGVCTGKYKGALKKTSLHESIKRIVFAHWPTMMLPGRYEALAKELFEAFESHRAEPACPNCKRPAMRSGKLLFSCRMGWCGVFTHPVNK